ncbi:MAG: NAD(P)H-quinone oxidoreductase subunit 4 [Prochloraceae cyanobacterium]|nr:NAD(P)H-quinone oxidoreductase subunit 4 [Prochloraceae cyanobacterium]
MISTQFPWLTTIILLPLIASLAIPIIPDKQGKSLRWYALGVGLADLAIAIYAFWSNYNTQATEFQLVETYSWIPQMGINWSLGVDGLSMPLIVLACVVTTLSILASWKVENKPKLFYFLMLVLYSAQIGVFAAKDMVLFFFMWELELVPVYLLIAIWGGPKRRYAATKFILYTALASIFILVGALALANYGDTYSFDMAVLASKNYPVLLETLVYIGFLIAYGVKLSVFPLHTWLPDAHGEASAPVSMILAGVLLKMGGYGLMRTNMDMLPDAHIQFAPILVILGVVNIVYGAFAAFGQTNLKRRLACSSISHMGFVLIGIGSFTALGVNGAMLQMLSHGLIAAALFFLAGVAYDRTHTLMMDEMGGLAKGMPKTFALFTVAAMASLALPGMSGFVAEISVFLGISTSDAYTTSFKAVVVILAAVGVILTPIYLLSMLRVMFYGEKEIKLDLGQFFADANPREIFVAACMLIPIVVVGFYPKLASNTYDVKTAEIAAKVEHSLPTIAQNHQQTSLSIAATSEPGFIAPSLQVDR